MRTAADPWDEATVTWNSRPTTFGSTTASYAGNTGAGTVPVPVTALVGGDGEIDLVLTANTSNQSAFSSREAGQTVAPTLSITSGY